IHAVLLLVPLGFLPIRFTSASTESFSLQPSLQLLAGLITSTAIPFFVVSTTAPLLQNWFSRTAHSAASDPYFLYSASNVGSLLALIAYPFVIEPKIGLITQSRFWLSGYLVLLVMFAMTAGTLYAHRSTVREARQLEASTSAGPHSAAPDWTRRFYWIA